jgi:hypothetical protein
VREGDNDRIIAAEAIVKAWRDEAYRERLIGDPAGVLREAGLTLPAGCRVTVFENSATVWHVAVPVLEDLAANEKDALVAELARQLPLPGGVELRLHQSTADQRFLVLPLRPPEVEELDDDELRLVTGGGNGGNGGAGGLFGGGNGGNGGAGGLGVGPWFTT